MGKIRVAILSDLTGGSASDDEPHWLERFVPADAREAYAFVGVRRDEPTRSSHERGAVAGPGDWRREAAYVRKALRTEPDVLVTLFPQSALAACAIKRLTGARTKIVAWAFNLGSTSSVAKGKAAGLFLRAADRLIVHSSEEVPRYAAWLGLPEEKVAFVPLQRGAVHVPREEADPPFALAMGSAGRDYGTLVEAAHGFGGKVVIVARPGLLEGLVPPSNVELRSGLSFQECLELTGRARITVVPVSNLTTASGQVTFLTSMAQGVAVVATDCPGTRDYLTDGEDALLVPPRDPEALRAAMDRLWQDAPLRGRLAAQGHRAWAERYSDPAAGEALARILDEVTSDRR